MEEKEKLKELLERITYLENEVISSERRYRNATTRERRKAEEEYTNQREWARYYIYYNARKFIFPQEKSPQDYKYWYQELPLAFEITEIKNRILEKLNSNQ